MNQDTFNGLLTTALSDVQAADDAAALVPTAQAALTSAQANAQRTAAQAATSSAAATSALQELLTIVPTPVPNAPSGDGTTTV